MLLISRVTLGQQSRDQSASNKILANDFSRRLIKICRKWRRYSTAVVRQLFGFIIQCASDTVCTVRTKCCAASEIAQVHNIEYNIESERDIPRCNTSVSPLSLSPINPSLELIHNPTQSCPRVTFLGPDPTRGNVDPTRDCRQKVWPDPTPPPTRPPPPPSALSLMSSTFKLSTEKNIQLLHD